MLVRIQMNNTSGSYSEEGIHAKKLNKASRWKSHRHLRACPRLACNVHTHRAGHVREVLNSQVGAESRVVQHRWDAGELVRVGQLCAHSTSWVCRGVQIDIVPARIGYRRFQSIEDGLRCGER